jgi:hypothetical protein
MLLLVLLVLQDWTSLTAVQQQQPASVLCSQD